MTFQPLCLHILKTTYENNLSEENFHSSIFTLKQH